MRTVFFGSPPIAVPALRALAETTEVVGVVCQPDRPAGRGLRLSAPAVKTAALELGLDVHQPIKVKTGTLHDWLAERSAEVAVVMAYGRILPPAVLEAPRHGCLNLHASLLPKYRGAAPIHWAIIRGERETGISLMRMTEGMDEGPVYCRRALSISPTETTGDLTLRLAALGEFVVRQDLPRAVSGELVAVPQDDTEATYAPPITTEMTVVDFCDSSRNIVDLVRGLAPKPGASCRVHGKVLKLLEVAPGEAPRGDAVPGTVVEARRDVLCVATADATVRILRAQLEGRKALGAVDLVNGRALRLGDHLGS